MRGRVPPAVADALVIAAWVLLAADSAWHAWRERGRRADLGPSVARGWQPPVPLRILWLAATLAGVLLLERRAGRFDVHPALATVGAALLAGGLVLHHRARRALGPYWSPTVTVQRAHAVVERGPYGVVRHPIALAVILLAIGTLLAHPSIATACLAVGLTAGLGLRIRLEERMLRRTLGADYERYAARVPAIVPRLSRDTRR
jgi:protein-S-isoprenylcysteine O-methyltransferase Ste14